MKINRNDLILTKYGKFIVMQAIISPKGKFKKLFLGTPCCPFTQPSPHFDTLKAITKTSTYREIEFGNIEVIAEFRELLELLFFEMDERKNKKEKA